MKTRNYFYMALMAIAMTMTATSCNDDEMLNEPYIRFVDQTKSAEPQSEIDATDPADSDPAAVAAVDNGGEHIDNRFRLFKNRQ